MLSQRPGRVGLIFGVLVSVITWVSVASAQPGVYGTIPGVFAVTQLGEASYSMPLDFPVGPGGVRPEFSLEYRHRAGDGPLGVGWNIGGLSQITRCPRTVAQDGYAREVQYDSGDAFCLDGQRLIPITPGPYWSPGAEYRTEIESFRKIVAHFQVGNGPMYFEVTERDGTRSYYGHHYGSSVADPVTGSYRQWMRYQVRDINENWIDLYWAEHAVGELLPNYVQYTRNSTTGLPAQYRADFVYEEKPIAHRRSGFAWTAPFTSMKRLARIDIKRESALIHRYYFGYVPEAYTPHRSLLETVTLCSPNVCVNGTQFEWADGALDLSGFSSPVASAVPHDYNLVGDFNGDGKQDIASRTAGGIDVFYSNGNTLSAADSVPVGGCSAWWVMEYDGDGRSDLLCQQSYITPMRIFNPTTSGWVVHTLWAENISGVHVADVNGDGISDILYQPWGSTAWWIALGTGSGFASGLYAGPEITQDVLLRSKWANLDDDPALELVGDFAGTLSAFAFDPATGQLARYATIPVVAEAYKVADINGDGRADLLYDDGSQVMVSLNQGASFSAPELTSVPSSTFEWSVVTEANNDGRDDLITTGSDGAWYIHHSNGATLTGVAPAPWGTGPNNLYLLDVTGDGRAEVLYKQGSGAFVHYRLEELPAISTFFDGRGNWRKPTYLPLTHHVYYGMFNVPPAYAHAYHGGLTVVDHFEANTGTDVTGYSYGNGVQGGSFTVQYQYYDAMMDNRGRGFLGFGFIREADSRHWYWTDRQYRHEYPLTGLLSQTSRHDGYGNPIGEHHHDAPVVTPLGPGRVFVHVDGETIYERDVNGALTRTIRVERDFDSSSGAVDQETVTTTPHSGEIYTAHTDFTLLNQSLCVGLPDRVEVTRSSYNSSQTRTIDNLFENCRLTSQTDISEEADPTKQLKTSYEYDDYGNIESITLDSANGAAPDRKTGFFYDAWGHFPVSRVQYISDELSDEPDHIQGMAWDYRFARPTSITDVSGSTTSFTYDDFGRLHTQTNADGSSSQFVHVFCFGPSCAPDDGLSAVGEWRSDGSETYAYHDSYGRDLQRATRLGPTWAGAAIQRRSYDALGNLDTETQPFRLGDPQYVVDYAYDGYGRLIQVSRPISEGQPSQPITTITYDRLTTTVTNAGNPGNQTTTYVADAVGRTVRVTDALNGLTRYEYNAFGQLTKAIDTAGHTTDVAFNNRGDKLSITDPDKGYIQFDYNVFGEQEKLTDAKGQVFLSEFDQLGRLAWRSEPDFPGINPTDPSDDERTTFTYYKTTGHLGLLQKEEFPDGFKREYVYDGTDRLLSETVTIDGTGRTTNFEYHDTGPALGKLRRIVYPTLTWNPTSSRLQVDYEYDGVGLLWKVKDGLTQAEFYRRDGLDGLGRETAATLGNGVTEQRDYDGANLALESIQTGAGTVQDLEYQWYPSGNLSSRVDHFTGNTHVFTYDALNRLETQSLQGGGQLLNVDYEDSGDGNIDYKSGVGSYHYGGASGGPHAVTSITGLLSNTYAYDANGNMTNRDGDTITWFSHDRPKKINYGSSSSEFWYGTDRSRYKHVAVGGGASATTRYFGGHFEVETRGGLTIDRHYILANGQAVAQYERRSDGSNVVQYLHRDHLGSVVATTNGSGGTIHQRWEYEPFGYRWLTVGSAPDDTERGYTGHEHLDAVDLIHMNGRVQDPVLGRFISADPFVSAPYHSQSLNRYSYVWNNPLSLVDPSGFDPVVGPPTTQVVVPSSPGCPFGFECHVATPEAIVVLMSDVDIQPAGTHVAVPKTRGVDFGATPTPQGAAVNSHVSAAG